MGSGGDRAQNQPAKIKILGVSEFAPTGFARAYADQIEADHALMVRAVNRGELSVDRATVAQGPAFRPG